MTRFFHVAAAYLPTLLLPTLAVAQLSVGSTLPAANQLQVAPNALVSATLSGAAATPATTALKVHSTQRGGLRTGHSGTTAVTGSGVSFQPSYPFLPGEVVLAVAGSPGRARVWQFAVAAGGTGQGYFAKGQDVAVVGDMQKVVAGDVDGDGDLDMLAANFVGSVVNVRVNDGSGHFSADPAKPAIQVQPDPYDLALGDLDGDGDLDLVTANTNSASVSVRLNDGSGRFSPPPAGAEVPVGYNPNMLALGDLDGDGDLDLVTPIFGEAGRVSVRLNNGQGLFVAAPDVAVGRQPLGLTLGDVDNDGDLDLAVSNSGAGTVSIRLNSGGATFAAPARGAEVPVGTYPEQMALRDLDGDSDADLLVTNNSIGTVSVRLNDGQGVFTAPASGAEVPVGGYPKGLALGDVDADGDIDFVVNTNTLTLCLNNGQAGFSQLSYGIADIPSAPGDLTLADVDGDLDLDLMSPGFANLCHVRLNGLRPVPVPPVPGPPPTRTDSLLATHPQYSFDSLVAVPNPAHGQVSLRGLTPNTQVELLDMTGRVIYTQLATSSQATLPLPATVAGVYILRCGARRRRLLIE